MPRFVKYLRSPDQFPVGFSFRPTPSLLQSSFFFFPPPFFLSLPFLVDRHALHHLYLFSFVSTPLPLPHVSFIQSGTNGSEVMPLESSLEIILSRRKGREFISFLEEKWSEPTTLPRSLWTLFSPSLPPPFRLVSARERKRNFTADGSWSNEREKQSENERDKAFASRSSWKT